MNTTFKKWKLAFAGALIICGPAALNSIVLHRQSVIIEDRIGSIGSMVSVLPWSYEAAHEAGPDYAETRRNLVSVLKKYRTHLVQFAGTSHAPSSPAFDGEARLSKMIEDLDMADSDQLHVTIKRVGVNLLDFYRQAPNRQLYVVDSAPMASQALAQLDQFRYRLDLVSPNGSLTFLEAQSICQQHRVTWLYVMPGWTGLNRDQRQRYIKLSQRAEDLLAGYKGDEGDIVSSYLSSVQLRKEVGDLLLKGEVEASERRLELAIAGK